MTDRTNSVRVSKFLAADKAGDTASKIKKGLYCTVQGKMVYDTFAKEMVLDPEVTHRNNGSRLDEKIERGPTRDMTVVFPDGTIIAEKTAVETLINVVKKIGVAEVRKVVEEYNLKFCKVPVISNRRDAKYGKSQKELGGGWLLITHSNNRMKKAFIENVSEVLHLGIKVTLKE